MQQLMKPTDVLRYLKDEDTYQSSWSEGKINTKYKTLLSEYLSYAIQDIENPDPAGAINTLSNLRPAYCCQMNRLLWLLGNGKLNSHLNALKHMAKEKLIKSYGIPVPRQLHYVIILRNQMEHLYTKPRLKQVRELAQLVEAFVKDTTFYTDSFPNIIAYSNPFKQTEYGFCNLTIYINQGESCLYVNNGTDKLKVRGKEEFYSEIFKQHLFLSKLCAAGQAVNNNEEEFSLSKENDNLDETKPPCE